jgi:hypothetical protein
MQTRVLLPALAAAALFAVPAIAAAQPYAEAKLATPLTAPKTVTLGGLQWSCTGDACAANPKGAVATWSTSYACRKVAAAFGPLAAYSSRGMVMGAGDIAACNKGAPTASAAAPAQTAAQ